MLLTKELTLPLSDAHIKQLKATEQNPKYHAEGNVYNHTLLVLEQFYQYAESYPLSEEEKIILYWAAVLHDIGKTKVHPLGWWPMDLQRPRKGGSAHRQGCLAVQA